jgi:hypothetical protein
MKRALLGIVLLFAVANALDMTSSILSRSLGEVAHLDTSALSCSTPESQFSQMNRELVAWGDIVQNKESIPKDLKTLAEIA